MIPAGRSAIDREGLAELHGLSIHQAKRVGAPWSKPGHPEPLTQGRPGRGRPLLWDYEQASAYAHGEPIPPLPEPGDPHDLLDTVEAAEAAGLSVETWNRYVRYERSHTRAPEQRPLAPPPDEVVHGTPHWYRKTIDAYNADRAESPERHPGGRPPGASDSMARADVAARIAELVAEAKANGEKPVVADIARRAGVHYTTAHRHIHALIDAPSPDR